MSFKSKTFCIMTTNLWRKHLTSIQSPIRTSSFQFVMFLFHPQHFYSFIFIIKTQKKEYIGEFYLCLLFIFILCSFFVFLSIILYSVLVSLFFIVHLFTLVSLSLETLDQPVSKEAVTIYVDYLIKKKRIKKRK